MTRSGAELPAAQCVSSEALPQPEKLPPNAHWSIDPPGYHRSCQFDGFGTPVANPASYHCCVSLKPTISVQAKPLGGMGVGVGGCVLLAVGVEVDVAVKVEVEVEVGCGVLVAVDVNVAGTVAVEDEVEVPAGTVVAVGPIALGANTTSTQ